MKNVIKKILILIILIIIVFYSIEKLGIQSESEAVASIGTQNIGISLMENGKSVSYRNSTGGGTYDEKNSNLLRMVERRRWNKDRG